MEGVSRSGDYFTGEVDCVVHKFDRGTGTYVPEVFINLDE